MRSSSNYLLYTYFPWARGLLWLIIHQASPSEWLAGWLAGSAQSEFFRSRFQGPLGASFHCPGGSDNHLSGKEASESVTKGLRLPSP